MQTILNVEGMSCSHCENAVKKAVSAIDGVTAVEVSLAGKTVSVTHDGRVSAEDIKREIEEAGYDAG
ncbi:MAG: copper ion binding protein [Oscillospiraceae bacterium]|jgi:copper chaperone|nr:copper ion binding protein [Oscillospiraceae bacterium]